MTLARFLKACLPALLTGLVALPAAHADFELRNAEGRRILLKDDGTWQFVDEAAAAAAAPASAASAPTTPPPQAELQLLAKADTPGGCTFSLALVNTLPYEIHSLVPEFAVQRANGVVYASQLRGFGPVKPGDTHQRDLRFLGIACADIAKLQVLGGDRCDMGDLNKFSDAKGECLARVRVLPSKLLSFEK
jgi:hypothetical protein